MWTLVVIFLCICALLILLGDSYRRHRKRIKAKNWVASQPPEVIISSRKMAAEKARVLLQEKGDYLVFVEEFGRMRDPEIQRLVYLVEYIMGEPDEFQDRASIERQIAVLEGDTVGNR